MKQLLRLAAVALPLSLGPSESQAASSGTIAFVRGDDYPRIHTMRPDGSRQRPFPTPRVPLYETAHGLMWSPDGRKVVFGVSGRRARLYVANADGRARRPLTPAAFVDSFYAVWSRDGRRIAYSTNSDGEHKLFVVDADGSGWRRLARGPRDMHPAWSPRGDKIVFTFDWDSAALVVVNADGRGRRAISRRVTPTVLAPGHVWARSGQIFFLADGPRGRHIFRIRPDGSRLRDLSIAQGEIASFAMSPDERRIAFAEATSTGFAIFVMNVDGSAVRRLSRPRRHDSNPSWSPDGRQIAFESGRDGKQEIYVMNAGRHRSAKHQQEQRRP